MKILGIVGWSGSGKTSLVTRLIPVLIARGLEVSTLKHAHHDFDVDQPGKDSHAHRHAGAAEVMISSGRRWALMHELRDEPGDAARRPRTEDAAGPRDARRPSAERDDAAGEAGRLEAAPVDLARD